MLFRVGLVLIRYALGRRGILKQCPTMYETVEFLRTLPPEIMHESVLVHEVSVHACSGVCMCGYERVRVCLSRLSSVNRCGSGNLYWKEKKSASLLQW